MPKVIIKTIDGASNLPNINDGGSTMENTIDVVSIGASCPTSNLTIVLFIAPNSLAEFPKILNAIINDTTYNPNVISISWGAPEIYFDTPTLNSVNNILKIANNRNINITAATGDYGSNDGVGGNGSYCDFPSSSPFVTACGGTNLRCPNKIYDTLTIETSWSSGGGGVSAIFAKPSYQNNLSGSKRNIPDIAMNADPNTGILYKINGQYYVIGGTSVVSPTFAGFLVAANINFFVNPIIYTNNLAFNDILTGSNGNYKAKSGYDNCTGMGSIKGNILNSILKYSFTLNSNTVNINVGATLQLIVNSNALTLNSYISWTSNNSSIVTVFNGLVKGIKAGTTTIKVASTLNPNLSINVTVNVTIKSNTRIISSVSGNINSKALLRLILLN
jgi:kumamolisin